MAKQENQNIFNQGMSTMNPQNWGLEKPDVASQDSVEYVKEDIQQKYSPSTFDIENTNLQKQSLTQSVFGVQTGVDLSNTDTRFSDVYAQVGDEFIKRYDTYTPGVDNNELQALNQSSWDKWTNGLSKAGVNIGTTVLGGTIGSVTGVANAISTGSMEGLYTDDFNVWLDEVNEKLNYKLPNYYSKQEQDKNFFQSMGTANFWANDVAGGISFTLGAIVSEGIWAAATGGAGLATSAARWGLRGTKAANIARGINQYQKIGKKMIRAGFSTNKARTAAKVAEGLNTLRFTYTSAGYEAGVEARQMQKEAEENFHLNFQEQYGRKPNAQEIAEFNERATTASNSLYAGNVALVGGSNLAIFGKMFNISNPLLRSGRSMNKGINKSLFGIGTEARTEGGRLVREAIKPTTLQKVAGKTYNFAKAPIIEGVWEEGNQSVMGNVANSWLESGYDKDATKNSYTLMEGVYDGYAETFGTKEGWKEVGIGMIVGLLGGGISGSFTADSRARKREQEYADAINSDLVGSQIIADKMFTQNQIFKANLDEQEAMKNGDYMGQQNARQRAMLSSIKLHKNYDRLDEAYEDFKVALNLVNNEQLAEENGVDLETIESYKQGVLEEYKDLQNKYSDNKDFADYVIGQGDQYKNLGSKQLVSDAIAYNLTMGEKVGESSEALMEMIQEELTEIVSSTVSTTFSDALKVKDSLAKASQEKRRDFERAKRERNKVQDRKNKLEAELRDSQKVLARTQDQEKKQQLSAKLLEISDQLEEVTREEQEANNEFELVWQTLQLDSPFQDGSRNTEYITAEQLDKVSEVDTQGNIVGGTLFEIDKAINSLAQTNPKKYERFKKLFNEYQKSIYAFKEFNKTTQGITSDSFNSGNYITKAEQLIGKNKEANQFTKEFFANIGEQIATDTADQLRDTPQTQVETATESDGDSMVTPVKTEEEIQESPVDRLRNLINEALKKNSILSTYIGEDLASTQANQPTKKETEEYQELHNKIEQGNFRQKSVIQSRDPKQLKTELGDQISLSEQEIARFQELNEKLSNWQVTEGTMIDGINSTLANLIVRLQQLETQPDTNQTKETFENVDAIKVEQASNKNSSTSRNSKNMVQTPEGVYLKVDKVTKNREISHLTLESLWKNLQGATANIFYTTPETDTVKIISSPEQLRKIQKTEGYEFYIELEDGSRVDVKIGQKNRLVFSEAQWEEMQPIFNIKFITAEGIDPQAQSFILGYTFDEQGNSKPATSDFTIDTVDVNRPNQMVNEELYNVKEVQAFVDPKNTYNQKLLDDLAVAKKSRSKKAIEKAEEALRAEVVVYLMSNNKIAGTLRGGLKGLGVNDTSTNYRAIREQAAQSLLETKTENLVNLKTTIPVQFTYNGSPIFNLNNETGSPQVQNKPITTEALEIIADAGYVQNGKVSLGKVNTEKVNTIYLPNTEEKTPIIVFKHRGENIAFPVSLVGTQGGLQSQLDEIIGFENISDGEKINRINEFLIQNGIAPSVYNLEERDLHYTNKITNIREVLDGKVTFPNVNMWATESYNLNNLRRDAQIGINITDKPFNSPKIKLDLSQARITARTVQDTREELETRRINQVNNLQDFVKTIKSGLGGFPNVMSTQFTDILDDQPFAEGNSYLAKQKNVNILRELSKAPKPKAVNETYGKEFFTNLKNQLNQLGNIESQEAELKSQIKMNSEMEREVKEKQEETCNS